MNHFLKQMLCSILFLWAVAGLHAQSISTQMTQALVCTTGGPFNVNYTATGTYNSNNTFDVQLSDQTGSFTNFLIVGSLSSTALSGTISCDLSSFTLAAGTNYMVRVVASSPSVIGSSSVPFQIVLPPSGLSISATSTNYLAGPPTYGPGNTKYVILAGTAANFSAAATGATSYSWALGSTASPSTASTQNVSGVTFATPGLTTVNMTATSGSCSSATSTNVMVESCTPQIPLGATVISSNQTVTNFYGSCLWICSGVTATLSSNLISVKVFVEPGAEVIANTYASNTAFYLRAGASLVIPSLSFTNNGNYVVADANASVVCNSGPPVNSIITCPNLQFDYTNAPNITGACNTNVVTASGQTVSSTLGFSSLCSTSPSFTVNYTASGTFPAGNNFAVQLSDASGSFADFQDVGSLSSSALSGTITCSINGLNIPTGTGYQIRVISTNPYVAGTPSSAISVVAPPTGLSITATGTNYAAGPSYYGPGNTKYVFLTGSPASYSAAATGATAYSWAFGSTASPATANTQNVSPVNYTSAGLTTVTMTASSGGCSSSTNTNVMVESCTPQIPLGTLVVSSNQTVTNFIGSSIWICSGVTATLSTNLINVKVFAEPGAEVIVNTYASLTSFYLKAGASLQITNLSFANDGNYVVADANASVTSNSGPPVNSILTCPNLQFDYTNAPNITGACNTSVSIASGQTISSSQAFTSLCSTTPSFTVNYAATGTFPAGNNFTAQLSDASGSFANFLDIGSVSSTALSGTITCSTTSFNLPTGAGYKIRVIATNPYVTGTAGTAFAIVGPPTGLSITATGTNYAAGPSYYGPGNTKYVFLTGNPANFSAAATGATTYSWAFGSSASPATATTQNVTGVSYSTAGLYTINMSASSGGCSATTNTNVIIESCTPTIPAGATVISSTQTITNSYASAYWVCSGVTATFSTTLVGTKIFAESGAQIIVNSYASQNAFYLKSGASLNINNLSFLNDGNYVEADAGASVVSNAGPPVNSVLTCSGLQFNYSNYPCGSACYTPTTPATCTLSGNTLICGTQSTVLTAAASFAATSYQLYYNGVYQSTQTSGAFTVNQVGSYQVKALLGSCVISSNTLTVITSTPAAPTITANIPNPVCAGNTVTLTSSYPTGNSWSTGATTASITVNTAGSYTVTNTTSGGCVSPASAPYNVVYNTVAAQILNGATASFCTGSSVILNAATCSSCTYLWKRGTVTVGTTSSVTVNVAGTYVLTVTNSGCSATASITVTHALNPPVPIISPTTVSYCQGAPFNLSTPPVSGMTYQWLMSSANISGATFNTYMIPSALAAGTYVFNVKETNSSGCSSTSANRIAVIHPLPTVTPVTVSPSTTVCQGQTVVLTETAVAGQTYTWYHIGSTTSIGTGHVLTINYTGDFYVTASTGFGCTNSTTPVHIAVTPTPSVSITAAGPTTVCFGGSVLLNASAVTGATYQWYVGGTPITGATSQSYTATTSGSYDVVVTVPPGCTATSNAIPVIVSTVSGATITAQVTLTANAASAYSWSTGASTQSIQVPLAAGTYSVTITDGSNCSYTTCMTVSAGGTCAGYIVDPKNSTTSEVRESEIKLSPVSDNTVTTRIIPNPNQGEFTISLESGADQLLSLRIYDALGQVVYNDLHYPAHAGAQQIRVNGLELPNGLYYLNITGNGIQQNHKIVISK